MSLILDPVASLNQSTLVFRSSARPESEVTPHLGRLLPTGGYLFADSVQERLAQIAGLTFAGLLPSGCVPPRIDVATDRQITLRSQHPEPSEAARQCAAELWRRGHASQVEEKSLGQFEVRVQQLPIRIRFTPDRRGLLNHLHRRLEGRRTQIAALADRCG